MIVDDDEDFIYIEEQMLKKAGYDVIPAVGGKECLAKLKNETPDIILMDVMMPEIDGWEVTKIIKGDKETKNIPVIMVTVKGSDNAKTRSFIYSHADGHVVKPIIEKELIETVRWVLDKGGVK
ncbi:MAG: response regulator [Candidatus Hydrothermarchaeaceae archaeon]